MRDKIDFFKRLSGKTFEERFRIPTFDEVVDKHLKRLKSNYPLRLLGRSRDKDIFISEEERSANFHILGEPEQGKSKFIEYNIREDIKLGNGVCLLDPSDNGDTAKKILAYCALKGIQKVVYIDAGTLHRYGKIATIKPLRSQAVKQSVAGVTEVTNILFHSKSTDTPRIKRNLSALLRLLARNNLTLAESELFSEFQDISKLSFIKNDRDSRTLKNMFQSPYNWQQYFFSTINRLDSFWEEPLKLILGADTGIDFIKMITEGWVILVNLFPGRNLTPEESQILGVLIISEIIQAVDILNDCGWKGRHYLYIDEAGSFATPQIKYVLNNKRKSGLRLMLAHHQFDQFADKDVLSAVKGAARIKVMFNTSGYKDRFEMVQDLGYGDELPPVLAAYRNNNIPKQQAVIKLPKKDPIRIRIPDVKDIPPAPEEYIKKLLEQDFYLTHEEIINQINARKLRAYSQSFKPRKAHDGKTTDQTTVPERGRKSVLENIQKPSSSEGDEVLKI